MFKRLIWADRIALICLGLLTILICMAWRDPNTSPFSLFGLDVIWDFGTLVIGGPWLLLRAVDLIFAGKIRVRRGQ